MTKEISTEPLAYTMDMAAEALQTTVPTLYKLIKEGKLRTYTIGVRRYCTREALIDFQRGHEELSPELVSKRGRKKNSTHAA